MQRNIKTVFVAFFTFVILFAILFLFRLMLQTTINNQLRYPEGTDCDAISQMFDGNDERYSPYWTYANLDKNYTLAKQGTGIYQCFCTKFGSTGLILDSSEVGICLEYCK